MIPMGICDDMIAYHILVFKEILSRVSLSLSINLNQTSSRMTTEKETNTMNLENDNKVLDSDRVPASLVPSSDVTSKCGLCHRGHISHPLAAGKLYTISGSNTHVHYFCMLFSAYAKQIGEDEEGLNGFYSSEVEKQIELARKKKCLYCLRPGATARCAAKRCNVTMHFQCGIEKGATFQFHTKNMYVFCSKVITKTKFYIYGVSIVF